MWKSMKNKLPPESGWYLASTNMGPGIFLYNQPMNEIGAIYMASKVYTVNVKVLHWDAFPECPKGDFDPIVCGFIKQESIK